MNVNNAVAGGTWDSSLIAQAGLCCQGGRGGDTWSSQHGWMEDRRGRDRPTLHLRTGTYAGVTDLWPVTMSADIHPCPHCLPGVLPSNNTDRRELQKIVQRLQSIGNVYWHDTRLLARYFYFIWRAAWPTFRERKYLYPTSHYKYLTKPVWRGRENSTQQGPPCTLNSGFPQTNWANRKPVLSPDQRGLHHTELYCTGLWSCCLTLAPALSPTSVKLTLRNISPTNTTMATTRVFFDMTADGAPVGKIIMEVS